MAKLVAFIHTKVRRADGTYDSYATHLVPVRETETPWHGRTQSGYGPAIPTPYMVQWNGRWYRVKVAIYSNAGSAYIGRKFDPQLTVDVTHHDD